MSIKSKEEELGDELCNYCPLPEEARGVHCYGGQPVFCEGGSCDSAYELYLDQDGDDDGV